MWGWRHVRNLWSHCFFFQFMAHWQPCGNWISDGWSIKFTFSLIVTFYLTSFNIYNLLSFYLLSIALSKGTIFAKKGLISCKKDASISKIKEVLVVNVYFLRLQCVCTYVPNFQFLAWFWKLLKGVVLSPLQKKQKQKQIRVKL